MGNISKSTKEKLKILILIFIITLVFSMPYLIPHRIKDTYWNIEEGIELYKYTPLKDGRIINFFILSFLEFLGIKMEIYSIVVHYICVIIYAVSIYNVYTYIIKLIKNKIEQNKNYKIIKSIILIGSVLIILNPLAVENFAYIDNLLMSLSILLGIIAAKILNENKKGAYIKNLILIILAGLCYQGNLNMWFALSVLYFAIGEKKTIKEWLKFLFKIVSIAILVIIFLVAVLSISNFIIDNAQSRLRLTELDLKKYINLFAMYFLELIINETYGYYPKMLIAITILITTLLIVNCERNKPINSLLKYFLLFIIIMFACILPAFLQSSICLSARMINGIGALIGISLIYLCYIFSKKENQNKKMMIILLILSMILFAINLFDYYNIAYMNHITMTEEQKYINQINEVMSDYEKENNIELTNVMFFLDENHTDTYKSLPQNTFNSRATVATYSRTYCLNYYTGRDLKEDKPLKEKYNEYFKGKDWNEFNKEQVKFEGNTVYICVY